MSSVRKEELKKKQEKERRNVMLARQTYAMENVRERATLGSSPMRDKRKKTYSHTTDEYIGGKIEGTEVDAQFASDMQNVKFCRKPVGFLMWLLYLVCLAVLIIPIAVPSLASDATIGQFVATCTESEPQAKQEVTDEDGENEEENVDEENAEEEAENASFSRIYSADEETEEETGDGSEDETAEGTEEDGEEEGATSSQTSTATVYTLSDPLFGWIKFVTNKLGLDIDLGDSPWYDAQISKTEVGMEDSFAKILIYVFPAFIILYAVLCLVLMLQTLICFASNDRRIFRFTGIESLLLLVFGLVISLGCFATTVEINGKLELGNIVSFLLGGVTGAGGFVAGYGLLIMLAVPVLCFVLSFFLLEKKLRGREITQPIVVYHYKEK